ncbi:MAG: acyl-CoA dehydrogenase family protein [Pseudomonadales bacterium]|jgi:alkylation response protein AidB-like acyl-CoA dehydrogenase|nr:acyl-CoA dehydrogenase family protein [Pseudomonadales bacterium]
MTSAELDSFRTEVRDFLSNNLTLEMRQAAALGFGIPKAIGQEWHKALFDQNWIAPSWPKEYGGTGWNLMQQHIFNEENALAGAPMIMPFSIGMVGPVIYTFGTDEQKKQHLPGIMDGSLWWCQGYSEPGSGSDLASLKTSAVQDGDNYIVNGQKIWTTNAHKADWIFALVRTDKECKPQQGISFLLIDMNSPGIEVKPIVSIDGLHHLNEVYFTDVQVPVGNRIGEENRGWTYAKFLLGHERAGIAGVARSRRAIEALREISLQESDNTGQTLAQDNDFVRQINQGEIKLEALAGIESKILNAMLNGKTVGAEASALKILGSELQQILEELRVKAVAYYAMPFDVRQIRGESNSACIGPEYSVTAVSDHNFGRASTIYGGSNEIQRNVIAKGVLNL